MGKSNMDINFAQNWPIYFGVEGFATFVIYAIIHSRQQEKKDKEAQNKDEIEEEKDKP